MSGPALNQASVPEPTATSGQQGYYKPRDHNSADRVNPLIKPEGMLSKSNTN